MIKIFLIESQKIVREGLKVLLEEESDFQVFANDNKDVKISQINQFEPDILLISLDNLDDADFDYINIFRRPHGNSNKLNNYQNIEIIVFAGKVDKFILNKALQLNCKGYLLKDSSIDELKQAIRSVYNGYKHIGNSVFSQIEQFSLVDNYPVKFSENNLIYGQEDLNTGLITTNNTNNNQLYFDHINLNNREKVIPKIQESLIIKPNKNKSDRFNANDQKYFASKQQNLLRSIGSSFLLITVGCVAGIVGVFSVRDRATESFKPIVQYGIVQGELMPIKTNYLGRISQLYFEVGDLVEVNEIVAQLESQSYRQQEQIIADFTQQIERIKQQIDNQKQLLAINQSHLNKERQKLQQLVAKKLEFKPTIQSQQEKSTVEAQLILKDVQEEVNVAFANYQKMQKLMEQKIVSFSELSRAKQVLTISQNKLIQIQNSHSKNSVNFSQKEAKAKTNQGQNIEYIEHLQENIELWQTQVKEKENTITLLLKDLDNVQNRLKKVQNNYEQQQVINIKSPTRGIVFHINQDNNELLHEEQTLMELLNCNNLWIEVIVDVNHLAKINFLQSAMVNLNDAQHSLSGAITSIHPLQNFGKEYSEDLLTQSSKLSYNSTENYLDNQPLFKIKIDFSIPDNYAEQYRFCALQETAVVTFNN